MRGKGATRPRAVVANPGQQAQVGDETVLASENAMTDGNKFKDRVRERMARTGESYMTAKRNLESDQPPVEQGAASVPKADAVDPLAKFHETRRQFRAESLAAWKQLVERRVGRHAFWGNEDLHGMVAMLNEVAVGARQNHVLFPDGGGYDLSGAALSHEKGCIELRFGGPTTIVRPVSLSMVVVDRDPLFEWAYFRLETAGLAPSGIYEDRADRPFEEVLELSPGEYVDRAYWDSGSLGEDENGRRLPLPDGARPLTRHFQGPFLIVAKASSYMALDKYIGFHAKWSAEEFRIAIQRLVERVHQDGRYGVDLKAPRKPPASTS